MQMIQSQSSQPVSPSVPVKAFPQVVTQLPNGVKLMHESIQPSQSTKGGLLA